MSAFFPPSLTSFTTSTAFTTSRLARRLGRTRAAAVLLLAVVGAAAGIGATMRAAIAGSARATMLSEPTWPPTSDNAYGTFDVAAKSSDEVWFEDRFGARLKAGLGFKIKVENPAPGSSAVSTFSVKLNGVRVVTNDSLQGAAYFEKAVTLLEWNRIEVSIPAGTGKLRLRIDSDYQPFKTLGWVEEVRPPTGQTSTDQTWQLSLPADAGGSHMVVIDNGFSDRTQRMACCGEVKLNGVRVFSLDTLRSAQARAIVPVTLQPGVNTIRAIGTDMTPGQHIWVRLMYADTAKPTLILSQPANNAVTNASSVTVSGTYQDSTYGLVKVGSASSHATLTMGTNIVLQSWSTTRSLVEGSNVIKIWARDAALNTTDTLVRTVIRDTQNPMLTVIAPAEGFVTTASSVTVSGTASDASGVTVKANNVDLPIDGSGNYSGSVPLSLGANAITVVATDGAGNTASQTRNVTRNAAPLALVVSSPAEGLITSASAVTVNGSVSGGTPPFTVTANGTNLPVNPDGSFAGSVSLSGEESIPIVVTVTDAAGATTSETRNVIRDVTAPTLNVVTPVEGATTGASSIQATGTVSDPRLVGLTLNGGGVTVNADNSFSTSVVLHAGPNTLTFVATDAAGNTSTVTRTVMRSGSISVVVQGRNPGASIERGECLTIAAGDGAAYECGDLRLVHELPATRTMNRERAPTLIYNSSHAKARSIIAADVTVLAGTNATSLEATVLIPGKPNTVRSFAWSAVWEDGSPRRIAVPVDGQVVGLPTGAYAYTLQVRALGAGSTPTGTDTGTVVVVDRSTSPFGAGWWLAGLEQLISVDGTRKLWIGGDGSSRLYVQQGTSTVWLATPAVDRPDTLLQVGAVWRRKLRNGGYVEFNDSLLHVATQNRQGHRTTFAYSGPMLTTITVPMPSGSPESRVYTFNVAGTPSVLSSVDAPALPGQPRTTSFAYRSGTRWLERITGPDTRWVGFKYDGADRVVGRRNRRDDSTFYAYDEAELLRQVSVDMRRTGEPAIVTTFCAAEGRSVAGCAAEAAGPQALGKAYTWLDGPRDVPDTTIFYLNRFGGPDTVVNALAHKTRIERADSRFPLLATAVVQPNGFRTEAVLNARALADLIRGVDPLRRGCADDSCNAITRYAWDPKWDMVVRTTLPTGEKDSVFYDLTTGNRLWQQDGRGEMSRTNFTYDSHNRVEYIQPPGNSIAQRERIEYDASLGNVWKVTSPLGFVSETLVDAIGRDTLVKTPFDSLQQSFRRQRTEYDLMDRPTLVGDGPGLSVLTSYDAEGLPVAIARSSSPDPAAIGEIKDSLVYDAAGRKIESLDSYRTGVFEQWTYDPAGNLLNHRRRNGGTAPMTYDVLNRLRTREVSSVGSEKTSVPSDVEQFDYDELGNVKVADNRFARIRRTYYPNGALETDTLRINTSDVTTNDYEKHIYGLKSYYDLSGRRVALKHPATIAIGGDSVAYRYDAVTGLLASIRDVNGAEYSFAYDSAQRLVGLTAPDDILDTTIYDADSRRKRRTESQYPHGISREIHRDGFVYDGAGRVLSVGTASPLHDGSFEYTILGAVRKTTEAVERTESRTIDAFANRADHDRWTDESSFIYTHVYDPHSTRLTGVGGRILGGEKEARDTLTHGYNLAGDLTGVTYEAFVDTTPIFPYAGPKLWAVSSFATARNIYSSIGRLSFVDRHTSEDIDKTDKNRLQQQGYSRMLTSNPSLGPGVYEEYRYDALGRRVWVRAHRDGGSPEYCGAPTSWRYTECLGAVQRTVWDGDNVLFEIRQHARSTTSAAALETDRAASYPGQSGHFGIVGYLHGPGIDRPLALRRHLGDGADGLKHLTLHRDWRGMVSTASFASGPNTGSRAECRFLGDTPPCIMVNWPATANTVNRSRSPNDSGPPSWYGTLAQEHRDGTGALYRRNRYYDPGTQRFTQEDPIGLAGGMNLYGFADGDPVNFSDPFGLCTPMPRCLLAQRARATLDAVGMQNVPLLAAREPRGGLVVGLSVTGGNVSGSCTIGAKEGCGASLQLNSPSGGASLDVGVKYRTADPNEAFSGKGVSYGVGRHAGVTLTNETFMINIGVSTPTASPVTVSFDLPMISKPATHIPPVQPDMTAVRRR